MPSRNIEIKASLGGGAGGIHVAETVAKSLAGGKVHADLIQTDTFFNVPNGRMKLRCESGNGNKAVLITYFRNDVAGPKTSTYSLCPVVEPGRMLDVLTRALGVKGVVEKRRRVYLVTWDRAPHLECRVHLDTVKNLGEFLEFEVMLSDSSDAGGSEDTDDDDDEQKKGQEFADELMEKFNITSNDLIEGAYVDSLISNSRAIINV